jgi:hypothetical protein
MDSEYVVDTCDSPLVLTHQTKGFSHLFFLDPSAAGQVTQRIAEAVGRELDLLPNMQRCGRVVQAQCVQGHGAPWMRMPYQIRPGSRVVTSWTSHVLPSGSLKEKNDP